MDTILQIASLVTFLSAAFLGWLNLYVVNKMAKAKDELISLFRAEIKNAIQDNRDEIKAIQEKMATTKDVESARKELTLLIENMALKIEQSNRGR